MALEDKVQDKESKGFMKKALKMGFKVGLAAGTTALALSTVGTMGPIIAGAFAGGGAIGSMIKGKSLHDTISESLTTYSAVNAVIFPMVWLGDVTYPLIPNETWVGQGLRALYAATLYNAAFVGSYRAASHLTDNYLNPKGMWNSITDNFYNFWKRIGIGFFPGYALAANGVSTLAGIPTFAWNALPLGIYNGINPVPEAKKQSSNMPKYSPMPAPA